MSYAFGVLGMPVGDTVSKAAVAAAGCTHTTISANWANLQPNGAGTALVGSQVTALQTEIAQAQAAGLLIVWENSLQYPPSWLYSLVEPFTDQNSATYNSAGAASGKQVTNWMWTSAGQGYVADFIGKLGAALGSTALAAIPELKTGGGWYGELHYAPAAGSGNSFYGYGASQQTGTGLASNQTVCPLPGYTIFSGTDAQDSLWLDWYLNGLGVWNNWYVATQRAAGFVGDYHVCHPGFGIRSNQTHATTGYRQSAALGEDPARMIGSYSHDPKMWPYCTWMNTSDGFDPPAVDSDISAWKKVYNEAVNRNKHWKLWGENTGGESNSGMNGIFAGNTYGSALSTATWTVASPHGIYGYKGMMWLNYASLTAGGANATLANYATEIATLI